LPSEPDLRPGVPPDDSVTTVGTVATSMAGGLAQYLNVAFARVVGERSHAGVSTPDDTVRVVGVEHRG
jgi:hypothetical protein